MSDRMVMLASTDRGEYESFDFERETVTAIELFRYPNLLTLLSLARVIRGGEAPTLQTADARS